MVSKGPEQASVSVCVCVLECLYALVCVAFTYACICLCFSSKGLIAPFGFNVLVLIAAYVVFVPFSLWLLSLSLPHPPSLFLYLTPSSLSLFCLTLSFSSFIFLAFPLSVLSSVSLSPSFISFPNPLFLTFLLLFFLPHRLVHKCYSLLSLTMLLTFVIS